ncbi:MAG: Ig-like domain-containing protein [Sporichthyaceae bacterium]
MLSRISRARRSAPLIAFALVAAALTVLPAPAAQAAIVKQFEPIFSANTNGAIVLRGNSSMTCPTSNNNCAKAKSATLSGTANNNNSFAMVFTDVDSDATTFNSSSSQLPIPAGASVLWAGLYWAGDLQAPSGGTAVRDANAKNTVRLSTPKSGGYRGVTAAAADVVTSTANDGKATPYSGFADVTSLVSAGGAGTYTVANIQAAQGDDRFAGWALVVAYNDPNAPMRNLTVFDGFGVLQSSDKSTSMTVSGFQTPPSGTVRTQVGAVSYEGDFGYTGDQLQLNGTNLTDAQNPVGNTFNSTVSEGGVLLAGRTPADRNPNDRNLFGVDIDRMDASGILGNNAKTATLKATTDSDTFYPNVITFATELYAPKLDIKKTVLDVNGGTVEPGDVLEYSLAIKNTGQDDAAKVRLLDAIPTNTAYVPGSLKVNDKAVTDASTDADAGAFLTDTAQGKVRAFIGTGATGTTGGTVAVGAEQKVVFRVKIDADIVSDTEVVNVAGADFTGAQTGLGISSASNTVETEVTAPRANLRLTKVADQPTVQRGQAASYTLTVVNDGPKPATNVVVTDTLPTGLTGTATSTQGTCTTSANVITCPVGTMASGATVTIKVNVPDTTNAPFSATDTATVGADQIDPNLDNNTGTASTIVNRPPVAVADAGATTTNKAVAIPLLGNDSDPDTDPVSVSGVGEAKNGSVALGANGTVTYTPKTGFAGTDTFAYTISDGRGGTATATVTVTVANAAPKAVDDAVATAPNTAIDVAVLANDTDANIPGTTQKLVVTNVGTPANGTAALNPDGTVTYTPNAGFAGTDTFTYAISDGAGGTAQATVTVTVPNAKPAASDDVATTPHATAVAIDVLANDADPNGDKLTVDSFTQPDKGKVVAGTGGKLVYTPPDGFRGVATFTYVASDGKGGTATATVTVTVLNAGPVAANDTAATDTGKAVPISVLGNDSDVNGDKPTITGSTDPAHGKAVVDGATVVYTPDAGYKGPDTFEYTISDGFGGFATAKVNVTVRNAPPVAVADTRTIAAGSTVTIPVIGNDTDPNSDVLKLESFQAASEKGGTVTKTGDSVVYTPAKGFLGTDTFTYVVTDSDGGKATGTVTIVVVNTAPEAVDDAASTIAEPKGSLTIDVLANDSDANGDKLTIVGFTGGAQGAKVEIKDGTLVYTYAADFAGTDVLTYTIDDGKSGQDTATVTLTVINPAPLARADSATTPRGVPVAIDALGNDTDPNGDAISLALVAPPASGAAVTIVGGKVRYLPPVGFIGTESFEYTIVDARGATGTGRITVTVVNQAPTAVADTATTPYATPVTIDVLPNDTDPEKDPLSLFDTTRPVHGTLAPVDGRLVYTPAEGWSGKDTFTYTVTDPYGGLSTATVTVTVGNAPPVARPDEAGTGPATPVRVLPLANDTDPNVPSTGQVLTVVSLGQPASGGKAELAADGLSVLVTPDAGFKGQLTVPYTISDGAGGTASSQIVVTVSNAAPVAADDFGRTPHLTPILVPVLGNDTDPNRDPLTVTKVEGPRTPEGDRPGTVEIVSGGVLYSPPLGFAGTVAFDYEISDGSGGIARATVTVIVENAPPTPQPDTALSDRQNPVTIDVLPNDTDPNGDKLTIVGLVKVDPNAGSVEIVDGTLVFTPNPTFSGDTTFSYVVSDGQGKQGSTTVVVTVGNKPPVAKDDEDTTPANTAVDVDVLPNDSDPDSDELVPAVASAPAHGSAVPLGNGKIRYTPVPSWAGVDTFEYTVSDGHGGTARATVTVTTENAVPTAANDQTGTGPNKPVVIKVLGNDSDPNIPGTDQALEVTKIEAVVGGSAKITDDGTTITFAPDAAFKGVATFVYTISDGAGGTAQANVAVRVDNAKPAAVDNRYDIAFETTVTLPVLSNDVDPNGDTLTITKVGQPIDDTGAVRGTVEIVDGKIRYAPPAGFSGQVSFPYSIADDGDGTDSAVVVVIVANGLPVAVNDKATTTRDKPVLIDVRENDSDPNRDPLAIVGATGGTPGSDLTIVRSGGEQTVRYVPAPGFAGVDIVEYTVSDGNGGFATATVRITVTNEAPVFTDAPANTRQDAEVGAGLTPLQVRDPDGDHVTVTLRSGDLPPGVTLDPDGSFTGTPTTRGEYTFVVAACDDRVPSACTTQTVTIRVLNQAPKAKDDTVATDTGVAIMIPVLPNDTDPDGDALAVVTTGPASHGTAAIDSDGQVRYTPADGWAGEDQFTYVVNDGNGKTDIATVFVTVRNANPDAVDDEIGTGPNTPVTVAVLANDGDVNIPATPTQSLRVLSTTQPVGGTAAISKDGTTVLVTPDPTFKGTLVFAYVLGDGAGGEDTATVRVIVSDALPVAVDDESTTPFRTPVTVDVLDNDTDANDDTLSIVAVGPINSKDGNPAGTVDIADGTLRFTPDEKFSGQAVFDYTISDGTSRSTATVRIDVPNAPPTATPATGDTDRLTAIEIEALGGDRDPNDDPISIVGVGHVDAKAGTVVVDRRGTLDDPSDDVLVFTPNPDFAGQTTFYYVINDNRGGEASAAVTVTVRNSDPKANDDEATTTTDEPVRIPVLDNDRDRDSDPLSVASFTDPAHGTVALDADGSLVYTPAPGWAGKDEFGYVVSDGRGGTAEAKVEVVTENANPVAKPDEAATGPDTTVAIDVLANDTDPNIPGTDQLLKVTDVESPEVGGKASIDDGRVVFEPTPGFQGPVTIGYVVSDGKGGTDTGTIVVIVSGAAPVAVDDRVETPFGKAVEIPLLGNDFDPNGDALTAVEVGEPSKGTATLGEDGKLTFTPPDGFSGSVAFPYTIKDATGLTSSATVTVVVGNGPPTAKDDNATTGRETAVRLPVLENDSDANGDPLSIVGTFRAADADGVSRGTVVLDDIGTPDDRSDDGFVFTPAPGFAGTYTFTYTIDDGRGEQTTATVTVLVTNQAPVFGPEPTNTGQTTTVGQPLVPLTFSDPDGDTVTVVVTGGQLPPGIVLNPDGTFTGTPTTPGRYEVTVRACDDRIPPACADETLTIVVSPTPVVVPPVEPPIKGEVKPTKPPTGPSDPKPVPAPKPKPKPEGVGGLAHTGAENVGLTVALALLVIALGIGLRSVPSVVFGKASGGGRRRKGRRRRSK